MASNDQRDRRAELLKEGASLNGIDFVEVVNDEPTKLCVHFINAVKLKGKMTAAPTITGGESIPTVSVQPIDDKDWSFDSGHLVLTLNVVARGDFSFYILKLQSDALDTPFFDHAQFSFKARCPSRLDCEPKPAICPPVSADVPPINYLAKDFLSFRQALLDFSALRYPEWQERSEADFGMMFIEALSALADDLSYTQDRIAAEATLDTATQRRSVARLARLVEYEAQPATAAKVMLQFDVNAGVTKLEDGLRVTAQGPDATAIIFETGESLQARLLDPANGKRLPTPHTRPVDARWNSGIKPYWFDDSERCLRAGATEMYVEGVDYGFRAGQALLIETVGATSADPPLRQIVHLKTPKDKWEFTDTLFSSAKVTRICWEPADALTADRNLTKTTLAGNLIPATQGLTVISTNSGNLLSEQLSESFVIPPAPRAPRDQALAIVRTGPNDTADSPSLQYLYTLQLSPLAWLKQPNPEDFPLPEILLTCTPPDGQVTCWPFLRRLVDAEPFAQAFTLDAARYSPIARVPSPPEPNAALSVMYDYDGDGGDTIRFGDGTFGDEPLPESRFDVIYRVSVGALGNVAADSINQVAPANQDVKQVTNPFPAEGGSDAEPLDRVRRRAPQEFRAVQKRAVLPADYEAAARTLSWVQRAGTVFRWTGSWQTVFTTADPLSSEQLTTDERIELINLLNRFRMAGYESYVPDPSYVSLDLIIDVCARPDAFRGNVEANVLERLTGSKLPDGSKSFFDPDNFTFGQVLEHSQLEAAIQRAEGVAGVRCIAFRVRGRVADFADLPDIIPVAANEIIRCDNDNSFPERGSLKIIVEGGK